MTREQLVTMAQRLADTYPREELRVVVMLTDESGDFVGVGMNTSYGDARRLVQCAHEADDLRFLSSTVEALSSSRKDGGT